MNMIRGFVATWLLCTLSASAASGTVSGDLKKWHKVTIDFDGPATSEQARPNPIKDYRLNVMIRTKQDTLPVPTGLGPRER